MEQELEIKLSVAASDLDWAVAWLLAQPEAYESETLTLGNTYYDTRDGDLNGQKIALRVRKMGDKYIQTLKTRGEFVDGAHRRQEWEWPLAGATLELGLLADTPLGQNVNLARLQPVFETNFQRRVVMIEQEATLIEVAIDSGDVQADGRSCPLNEIELELKGGDASALLAWAKRLADEVPVFLNLVSKAEQGYYLAGLYEPVLKSTAGSELAVNDFLSFLSVSWLTGGFISFDQQELAAISRLATKQGVSDQYQQVVNVLAGGGTIQNLLSGKELGQLQLAIASDD